MPLQRRTPVAAMRKAALRALAVVAVVAAAAAPAPAAATPFERLPPAQWTVAPSPLTPSGRLDVSSTAAIATATTAGLQPASGVATSGRRSLYKAALFSALLPGLGEAYAGRKLRAIGFGVVEGGIWVSYATFKTQELVRRDRAIEFAVAAAGASPDGDEDYYKAVARFLRSDGANMWNEFVRRRARDVGEVVGREYFGAEAWAWQSEAKLERYRDIRIARNQAQTRARNVVALAIVNRILSVIDAVYLVRSDQRRAEEGQFGLKVDVSGSAVARVMLQNRF